MTSRRRRKTSGRTLCVRKRVSSCRASAPSCARRRWSRSTARRSAHKGSVQVSFFRIDPTDAMADWSELAGLGPILDGFPFQAWVRDVEGRCVWQNESARARWGSQVGHIVEQLDLPEEMRARIRASHDRALGGEVVETLNEPDEGSPHGGFLGFTAPLWRDGQIVGTTALRLELAR